MKLLARFLLSIVVASPAWAAITQVQHADTYPGEQHHIDEHESRQLHCGWCFVGRHLERSDC